jgi:diguanylate cyclase (GGDEF)-like protein
MLNLSFTPLVSPLLAAAALNIALAYHGWTRRRFPGAVMLGTFMAALAEWSIAYSLVIAGADLETKMFWYRVEYLGVVTSSLAWVVFTLQYAGVVDKFSPRLVACLCIEPLITLVLVWTNAAHGFMWPSWSVHSDGRFLALDVTFGTWYWLNVAYGYCLYLGSSIFLAVALARRRRLYISQIASLVFGLIAPLAGNMVYNAGLVGSLDLAPFAFTLSGLTWWFGFSRFKVLEAAPVADSVALESVFENMVDGVLVTDAAGSVVKCNAAAAEVLNALTAGENADPLQTLMSNLPVEIETDAAQVARAEVRLGDGGARRDFDLRLSPLWHRTGGIAGRIIALRDITDRKLAEEALAHQARHDALTGLPNRTLLLDSLTHATVAADREGETAALLFLDLDNFKTINDSLGHAAGDELLVAVADRLRTCLRPGDLVARLGGDEFAVIVAGCSDRSIAQAVAERLIAVLREPFQVSSVDVIIAASVGIALTEPGASDPGALLRNADAAMYAAKARGKGRFEFFAENMHLAAQSRLAMHAELLRALANNEFVVHYQPVVNLTSGTIVGGEALVRWLHPQRGMVAPLEFIPACEELGLIVPLGHEVLRQACKALKDWQLKYSYRRRPIITVNVSPRQLQQPDFVERVAATLEETGVDPTCLVLEITEGVLLDDGDATLRILEQLHGLGVRLAIDDFGTGYSALSYLQRFPIHVLKIDRSFVNGIRAGGERSALVRAIIALGQALNLKLVAEGIEDAGQAAELGRLGCELGQGYYFARPEPRAAFELLLDGGLLPQPELRVLDRAA